MHLIHDLRLVLLAIVSCLETLRERVKGDPLPTEVEHIARLLETGVAITDELLVSRSLHPAAPFVEVNRLLADLDGVVGAIVGADVALRTKLGAPESRVYAQPLDLERILLNAVFNAAAAMPTGGALLIETDVAPTAAASADTAPFGNLRLTIRDTGCGIPESRLADVIDPMAKPRQDGSGLGLASIALILSRIGGSFSIESRPNEGTVVSIALPLWPGHGSQPH
jgi:signal transduction histidine kinase